LASTKQESGDEGLGSRLAALLDSPELLAALAGGLGRLNTDALYDAGLSCMRGNLFASTKLTDDAALNRHFCECPADLFPVMAWALRVNCSGFFALRVPELN
jgi:hypothetical protein